MAVYPKQTFMPLDPRSEAIVTEAQILCSLDPQTYRLKLDRNGHQLVGHLPRKLSNLADTLCPGDRVRIEMSPYDLEKAKIVKKK